ncbi:hydantoinase/carbamoylase family amidase [Lampropedia puyangensis]|uniref:Hydantoinase/carbamoylase family amidase n=1 Tax=Lampropedia puyangensis TaxID=1330072 RepID=A0A4S8FBB3_9BURK|nr:Zn-dependent hydrolase [Lampropedia puyangensis]THU04988.1 hydantoinase/carbamoylase family amidase [Lampropedia puyangensis]
MFAETTIAPTCSLAQDITPEITLASQWFDTLRERSRSALGVTRASFGEGEQMAHDLMAEQATRLGLEQRVDAAGNLYLTLPGRDRSLPAIMTGSHMDTVPDGGNFDGAAGVVAGMAMLARWVRAGLVPQRDITVMAVRAEELSWFPAPYAGSRAAFGLLQSHELDDCLRPDTGLSLFHHMQAAGFAPERVRAGEKQLDPARIHCFLELHIEQGPFLVQEGLPVGIVTGIRGNLRYKHSRILGQYAHAGAEPRRSRHDAVMAGAEFVQRLEALWLELEQEGKDLVCTVGQFYTDAKVHTMTKVPGELRFTMDIRSQDNALLLEIDQRLRVIAQDISARRGVVIDLGDFTNARPGLIHAGLHAQLLSCAAALKIPHVAMASGAGHDSAVFSQQGIPTAMVFVRNEHGSHNPDEAMEIADFAEGLRVLIAAVEHIDEQG